MPATVTVEQPAKHINFPSALAHRRRWLIIVLAIAVLALGGIVFAIFNWPFTEQALIDVLQERTVRSVTIAHFRRTYWPPGCVAEGIRFLHRKRKDKPSLITIDKLVVEATYPGVLIQRHLSKVRAIGMHIIVPPKQDGKPNPIMPLTHGGMGPSLVIGTIVADGAVLDFVQKEPGKKPFRLTIDKLAINGVGNNQPLSYVATLSNTMPPGKIRSRGVFGPWNADDPALTPVNGSYTFERGDLGVFRTLRGTLFSGGRFNGKLCQIQVAGSGEVLNFQLTRTSHTRKLNAEFRATVDATNGDTTLESVTGRFDRTTILFHGSVVGQEGQNGKIVSLDMDAPEGRIEDLLNLFIEAKHAPMTGNVSFRAHVEVPPVDEPFIRKMKLTGDFGVGAGRFRDKDIQGSINRLRNEAVKNKDTEQGNLESAVSDLRGHVVASDGTANLSKVSFRVTGATAGMHGTYGLLDPYKLDLHGQLLADKPSDATTGFKSFLLKAMSPFLKRSGTAKVVPFKITGSFEHSQIGLDLGPKN
jgi:hypothetical protein